MSVESGPLVSMIILGATGVAFFEPRLFVGAVLPFLIGFALGNLDSDLRELFGRCVHPLIPFFGFALGNGIDLNVIVTSGLPGIVLGLGVIVVTGIPLIFADRWIAGGNGAAGLAASSTAGAAVANPAIIGEMIPRFKPLVPAATAMVATACLVTAILVPILTALWVRRYRARHGLEDDAGGRSRATAQRARRARLIHRAYRQSVPRSRPGAFASGNDLAVVMLEDSRNPAVVVACASCCLQCIGRPTASLGVAGAGAIHPGTACFRLEQLPGGTHSRGKRQPFTARTHKSHSTFFTTDSGERRVARASRSIPVPIYGRLLDKARTRSSRAEDQPSRQRTSDSLYLQFRLH